MPLKRKKIASPAIVAPTTSTVSASKPLTVGHQSLKRRPAVAGQVQGNRRRVVEGPRTTCGKDGAPLLQVSVKTLEGQKVAQLFVQRSARISELLRSVTAAAANTVASIASAPGSQQQVLRQHSLQQQVPLRQRLVHQGTLLCAGSSLADCCLEDGAQLTLVASRALCVLTIEDSSASLWNARTGQRLQTLDGHQEQLLSAVFSADSTSVLTASADNTARLWNASTGECVQTFTGHEGIVHSAVFSPGGTSILTASGDRTAKLWRASSGECLHTFTGHEQGVTSAAFCADGTSVLTTSDDCTARLWSSSRRACVQTFAGHAQPVRSACFSPDEELVVTSSGDGTVRVWSVRTGECSQTLKEEQDNGSVQMAVFSLDGASVLTAGLGCAKIWTVATGKVVWKSDGHEEDKAINSAWFSADGSRVLTSSSDGSSRLWCVASGRCCHTFKGHKGAVLSAVFSTDGAAVLTVSEDGTARLWNSATGEAKHSFQCSCRSSETPLTGIRRYAAITPLD